jgi:hypothetical protein
MTENRSGHGSGTQRPADQRHEKPTKQSGDEMAHNQPPNPVPAEGPRDPEFTRDTYPQSVSEDQETRTS